MWILAVSGILEARKYTTSIDELQDKHRDFFGMEDPFPLSNYVEGRVVRDNNVITAKGYAFIDFAVEVCDYFGRFQNEDDKKAFSWNYKGF